MSRGISMITNGDVLGSRISTPIINMPQAAISGMHNIVDRPVALAGQIVIGPDVSGTLVWSSNNRRARIC